MRGAHDDATPNANAMQISNLVALHLLTGKTAYLERAEAIPHAFAGDVGRNALGHSGMLAGVFDLLAPQQVVVIGPGTESSAGDLGRAPFRLSLPGAVQQRVKDVQAAGNPALTGKTAIDGTPTAYVCIGPQCSLPVTAPDALVTLLRQQRTAAGAS
jgi:uncharacterized protein YyaL (SSP411 family)